jgi:TPR repeat protein
VSVILGWAALAFAADCADGPTCLRAGFDAVDADPEAALALWLAGCETHAHARSCWKAANLLVDGFRLRGDYDRSTELKERAFNLANEDCGLSDAACTTLGLCWYWGIGVDKDTVDADALLHKACAAGDGEACHWEAVLSRQCLPQFKSRYPFSDYCGEDDDDEGVAALLQRSCELGWSAGCIMLGQHAATRLQDDARAARALERACALGDAEGCLRAGRQEVATGALDAGRARLARVCTSERPGPTRLSACVAAAAAASDLGVVEQACGDDAGCWHDHARVLAQGAHQLPAPQPALAGEARARACALGHARSCD